MKLSELTPCAFCKGPIDLLFYRVTTEQIMLDTTAANQVLGLNTIFGGALRLAEALAPHDEVTMTLQNGTVLVCADCYYERPMREVLFPDRPGGEERDKGHEPE